MRLTHLSLENFRNFAELEVDVAPGVTVLFGGNGQGKTNLLEAVSMLAMGKSLRAGSERELISWHAQEREEIPFARVKGAFQRAAAPVQVELVVQAARVGPFDRLRAAPDDGSSLQKRARLNGVPKRASDIVGEVNDVLFEPQDIELVHGAPSVRRRYLNVMLSQADRGLLRELQRYTKVLAQRNSLLKAIRERRAAAAELEYWDNELVASGSAITRQRLAAMQRLETLARGLHEELTGGEELDVRYEPSVTVEEGADASAEYRRQLEESRDKELLLGTSLVGPHRDDFRFMISGRDMAVYASRGQQRTASLALKLAEARFLAERAGDPPVLLLDDVFSELDARRQGYVLAWINGWEQSLVTTAEPERIDRRALPAAAMLEVRAGRVGETG